MYALHLRQADYHYVVDCVQNGTSCSIIGLSNTGKSMLLRDLVERTTDLPQTFIYVDCNLMLAATDQGFYEAVLRSLRETLARQGVDQLLLDELLGCYETTVQADSPFLVPLGFNDAVMKACQALPGGLVLLLDEFDEAYAALASRVFLNLRALRDKYKGRLTYVTATAKPLREIRTDPTIEEFYELVSLNERHLGMLSRPDTQALLFSLAERRGETLDNSEIDYAWQQSGGHPGLLEAVAQILIKVEAGAPELYRQQGLSLVTQQLDRSDIAQAECVKLWHQLSVEEQDTLLQFAVDGAESLPPDVEAALNQKGILSGSEPQFFSDRFAAFVRRRRTIGQDFPEGIWLDVDAGDVWVEGQQVPTLTELEYRLLQTLYGRLEKICDKYLIVESVWGQEYIDQVDDARIEKLVSRLRSKIEPNASEPSYLITVRGRGYKLLRHPDGQ